MKRYIRSNDIINTFTTQDILSEYVGTDTWIKFQDIYGYYRFILPIDVTSNGVITFSYVSDTPDYRGEYPHEFYCRKSNLEFFMDYTICYPLTMMTSTEIENKFNIKDTYPR